MDKKECFLKPVVARHRQYEALRAVYVDGMSLQEAARRFDLSAAYLKKVRGEFHQALQRDESYFFPAPKKGRKEGRATPPSVVDRIVALRKQNHSVPDIRAVLAAQGEAPSLTTIAAILKQEGFAPLPKRTRQERAAAAVPPSIEAPESTPLIWRHETFTTEQGGGPLVFLPLLLVMLLKTRPLPLARMLPVFSR